MLFSGVFLVLLVWLGTHEVIDGELTDRPADQLPRLRAVHGLADPDLLRVRPEAHPGDWCRRARRSRSSSSSRRGATRPTRGPCPTHGDLVDEETGFVAREGQLTIVVSAVPEDIVRAGRPAGPLPAHRRRAGQPGHRRGAQGPRRPAGPGRARGRARPDRRPRRGARPPALGRHPRRRRPVRGPARPTYARRILVSDTGSQLFAGTLQDAVDPHGRLDRRAGRGGAARRQRRGRLRRPARRLAGPARRARPRAVRRAAAAGRAGPRARGRRAGAGAGRADVGRRRPHRGADRRAGGRRTAAAGRPWSPPCRRCGCTTPTGSCWSQDNQAIAEGTHEDLLLDSPDYRRVVTRAMDRRRRRVDRDRDVRAAPTDGWEVDDRV